MMLEMNFHGQVSNTTQLNTLQEPFPTLPTEDSEYAMDNEPANDSTWQSK